MKAIKDRQGRRVRLTLYAAGGKHVESGPEALAAALRLRRALPGRPALCARGLEKIFGLVPARLGLRLWNGKELLFNAPADLPNFISDIDGIILKDQYDAGGVAGRTVIDAGANLGLFSLYALALGAKKIYAFEAVAETFALLKANLALNRAGSAVKAVNIALGKARGRAELLYNTRGEGSARLAGPEPETGRGVTYACRRQVPVAPLDALVKTRPGFIKIDVEGQEENVLLGAAGLIKKYKPVLSFAAYHRKADKKNLPAALRGLRADYCITLNTFAEHDFLCR
jgi:FkbM family methyltransferase